MMIRTVVAIVMTPLLAVAQQLFSPPPRELPPLGTAKLSENLTAAKAHARHLWRDTPPINPDGTVNAYIEIARGDRRKWEFNMRAHEREIDRMIPETIGGYPVNYGFVPQTVSYDGDPFDALVLGPSIDGGRLVRGTIAGLLFMEDEKGTDSKVVLSTLDDEGRPRHRLTETDKRLIADYFNRYKEGQPGMFSRAPGWGSVEDGLAYIRITHRFFHECRSLAGRECAL